MMLAMAACAHQALRVGLCRGPFQEAFDHGTRLDIVAFVAPSARGVDGLDGKHEIGRGDVRLVVAIRDRRATAGRATFTQNPEATGSRGSVPQGLPHESPADFQALPEGPSWLETTFVGQLDHRGAGEMDFVKGLADGQEVRTSFSHRFGPLSVGLLIAEIEEDDLLSMVVNELSRIDPIPDQPVQVGAQLDIRNPRQSALES